MRVGVEIYGTCDGGGNRNRERALNKNYEN